ncbi:MAG TPA: alpha-2-macroglobulin family protein, partial [Blastocatellia bacterium]|nr:alpha-2-macroglobulin family protein [Blastocatellia bacterium]
GDKTSFAIEARYFFGEPVTNAGVKYYIYRSRYYTWWWTDEEDSDLGDTGQSGGDQDSGDYGYGNDMVKDGEGHLDSNGRMVVEFQIPEPDEKDSADYTYRLEAQVTDAARRAIDGAASLIGTRGNVVADANPDRYVYYQGDNAKVRVRTADYEGHPVAAKVTLKFIHRTWEVIEHKDEQSKYNRYEYKLHENEMGSADVTTSSQGQGEYSYQVPATGNFNIKAIITEGSRHYSSNGGWLWVADRGDKWADFSYENSEQIKLIPDKKSYQPGETAHVLAMLPIDKTHLLVTTELGGVMTARVVDAGGRAAMIDVPIDGRYSPNAYLSVCLIKDGDLYSQDHILSVPARNKFLKLDIITDKNEYKPRETASYTIIAHNQDGSPAAGTEVSLGLVDEAIYSIKPDQSGDIRRAFYGRRYNRVQTQFSVSYSFSGYSGDKRVRLAQVRKAYDLADFKNEGQYSAPAIRKEFKDTAFWQPTAVTGPDGKATVSVSLPDNLTTWRATAKAVTSDTKVGSSLAKVISRKNLILRLETPRFLTKGDTVTISGIVHNYTNADKTIKVRLDVDGVAAKLLDQKDQTITLAKQGEQRIDWRVNAGQVGDAKLLAVAQANDLESDGVELPLPVVPAGLQFTTGGTMSIAEDAADKSMKLDVPGGADPQARYLRIEVAPSIAGSLFGALDYLTSYPYGCTEQTMSSFLPNIAVAQALKDVKTTSIKSNNDLGAKIQRGMNRLYDFQHADGGWGWWKDDKTDPFMTAYVVDGLTMATRAGYPADAARVSRGREKLKQMISAGKLETGKSIDPESRAYMIYALAASGDPGTNAMNDLFTRRNELQPYGRALLALSLKLKGDDARARELAREIESTAKANEFEAHWDSERKPMLDFSERDDLEATALSLKALSQIAPSSPILARTARWLLNNRRYGYYWDSTKQTAFAIFGLIDYIRVTKELSADYDVEVYLNGQQVGQTKHMTAADVAGGNNILIERRAAEVPGQNQIRVVKKGNGIAYVSASLQYYTREEDVQPQATPGLSITREYMRLVIKGTEDKPSWAIEPLTGQVHSGDTLVVRLRVKGDRNNYMMIEDPIPAGCEQLDRISGLNLDYSDGKWSDWYSAREFRDQRTLIFLNYFSGSDTFQYALTVQEPGDFRAGPARAELMYAPTVQANTGTAKMSIMDKK